MYSSSFNLTQSPFQLPLPQTTGLSMMGTGFPSSDSIEQRLQVLQNQQQQMMMLILANQNLQMNAIRPLVPMVPIQQVKPAPVQQAPVQQAPVEKSMVTKPLSFGLPSVLPIAEPKKIETKPVIKPTEVKQEIRPTEVKQESKTRCEHRPITPYLILAALMDYYDNERLDDIPFEQSTLKFSCRECNCNVFLNVSFIGQCYRTDKIHLSFYFPSPAMHRAEMINFTNVYIPRETIDKAFRWMNDLDEIKKVKEAQAKRNQEQAQTKTLEKNQSKSQSKKWADAEDDDDEDEKSQPAKIKDEDFPPLGK